MSKKKVIPVKSIANLESMAKELDELNEFLKEIKRHVSGQMFISLCHPSAAHKEIIGQMKEDTLNFLMGRTWREICDLELKIKTFVNEDLGELLETSNNGNT